MSSRLRKLYKMFDRLVIAKNRSDAGAGNRIAMRKRDGLGMEQDMGANKAYDVILMK